MGITKFTVLWAEQSVSRLFFPAHTVNELKKAKYSICFGGATSNVSFKWLDRRMELA